MPRPQSEFGAEIYDLERKHVFHSWSAQDAIDPMVITGGQGPFLEDADGKRYIDFSGQLVFTNLGFGHPSIVAAIQEQAAKLSTIAPAHANEPRARAAQKIVSHLPENLNKVFFTNGGADAVEHAIRMARLHTGRDKVLAGFRGYHGGTHTTLQMSGDNRRWGMDRGDAAVVRYFPPFTYRSPFGAKTEEEECAAALNNLENIIQMEGPELIAAFIMETIPGTAGVIVPPANYWKGVREICDRYGIVMICDEVMAGFGRTGTWFAFENFGVIPDLVTFAKGVNSGYVPLGGVAISDEIAKTFAKRPYPGGLTYSGHPLAAASAVGAITAMEEEGSIDNARRLGEEILGPTLRQLAQTSPLVGEARGLGCFWALELVKDKQSREPLSPYGQVNDAMKKIAGQCAANGVLVQTAMNRIHICPPLNIEDEVLRQGLQVVVDAINEASSSPSV